MATTAIWSVKGNLGRVVDYAANPEKTTYTPADLQGLRDVMNYATQDYKTEEQRYVSGVNCAPEIAREQMLLVKRQFGKEGGVIAFHGYQSFAPGEVTPEQAHEIGVELAKRLWGDRFQVIVATHLDRAHLHNHFVLNSVSFVDGKKYNYCKASYALMRRTSDELCREHGLSVIEQPERG
ncbi:MAG: relaxase/mobilization nuclease domain-containing protein, partial [Oscillospiraceae bacterium]|nr:relaxase/mobilization nuclease domain-containing protein [Oscillospiraceae bacterium]